MLSTLPSCHTNQETLLREGDEEFLLEAQKIKHGSIKEWMTFLRLSFRMGEFHDNYGEDEKLSSEDTQKFYDIVVPYFAIVQDRMDRALAVKRKIDKGLERDLKLKGSILQD